MANRMVPRGTVSTRTSRCRSAAFPVMTGMKSRTSPRRRGHEPRDQDRRAWEVELPAHKVITVWRDTEVTALVRVHQGGEHAGRSRTADSRTSPRPVSGHQCRGLQVANQAMVADAGIACHVRSSRSVRRAGYALDPWLQHRQTSPRGPRSPTRALTRARPGCGRPPGGRPWMPSLARTAPARPGLHNAGRGKARRLGSRGKPHAPQVRTDHTSRSFAASRCLVCATAFRSSVGPGRRCRSSVLRGHCPRLNDPPGRTAFASAGSLAGTPASRPDS
jgi:hypothetical protein